MSICLLCGEEVRQLGTHCYKVHGLARDEYEIQAFHNGKPPVCKEESCTNLTEFDWNHPDRGFKEFCCKSCATIYAWKHNDKFKLAVSENTKSMWRDPEYRSEMLLKLKEGWKVAGTEYDSIKGGRVYARSSWELEAFQLLDHSEFVLSYTVEPFGIPYFHSESCTYRRYYPDILVNYKHPYYLDHNEIYCSVLVEIKPEKFVLDQVNQDKFLAAIEFVKTSDKISEFVIVTEHNHTHLEGFW